MLQEDSPVPQVGRPDHEELFHGGHWPFDKVRGGRLAVAKGLANHLPERRDLVMVETMRDHGRAKPRLPHPHVEVEILRRDQPLIVLADRFQDAAAEEAAGGGGGGGRGPGGLWSGGPPPKTN